MDFKQKVEIAYSRVKEHVWKTPLAYSYNLSALCCGHVYFKLESEQVTGSYKVRGAFNKLRLLCEESDDIRSRGVVAASSGNFGIASTYVTSKLGVPCKIYVPNYVSTAKLKTMKLMGADTELHGDDCVDTEIKARTVAEERKVPYLSAYNDIDVVHGQGTIGLEIYEELKDVDYVLVPVGGGGLISGIAGYLKAVNPSIKIIGCQPENSKCMYESIKAGKIVFDETLDTLSDGTAGGLEENCVTFGFCQKFVDDWVLVNEEQIQKAVYFMLEHHHKIVEGAAGVSIAAFLKNLETFKNKNVVIISSGSNITIEKIISVINKEAIQ